MFKAGDKVQVKALQEDLQYICVWDDECRPDCGVRNGDILTIDRQYSDEEWNNPKLNGITYIADEWVIPGSLLVKYE
jgi:hypothetical protein